MGAKTWYVKSGDIGIVDQVVGDGPLDVVLVPGRMWCWSGRRSRLSWRTRASGSWTDALMNARAFPDNGGPSSRNRELA